MDDFNTALHMAVWREIIVIRQAKLTDACYTVPVALTDQNYLLFRFQIELYQVVGYLDDSFLVADIH